MTGDFGEQVTMVASERRAAVSLSAIYALRMLGLFMVFPVLSLYSAQLAGATPATVGLAIGIYGLTQALLQIPFGMLSDRYGRKRVIAVGMLIFVLGSIVAAVSDSIYGVIFGRAVQGAGAIAAAVMALAADLTRETQRTKIMGIIGVSIGASFFLALLLGPLLIVWIDLAGIFWITAALGLGALVLLYRVVPTPTRVRVPKDTRALPAQLKETLKNGQLVRLDLGIFLLHLILTASFVVLPLALRDAGLAAERHWQLYLPVLLVALALMVPTVFVAERRGYVKPVFLLAIGGVGLAELLLAVGHTDLLGLALSLMLFFAAFNVLEATLPSLISKIAPAASKGSALGLYSTSQFLGAFVGGACGGVLHDIWGFDGVFLWAACLAGIWFLVALSMEKPKILTSYLLNIGQTDADTAQNVAEQLSRVRGVAEAVVIADEGIAYLKVDRRCLDEGALRHRCLSG